MPIHAETWFLLVLFLLFYIFKGKQEVIDDSVVTEIFQLHSDNTSKGTHRRGTPFSRKIMIFCTTLARYSQKAYGYVFDTFDNCLPSSRTLQKYRNRVDGSPGFSTRAIQMIVNKVSQLSKRSKRLFISLSCDDISIRDGFDKNILSSLVPFINLTSVCLSVRFCL